MTAGTLLILPSLDRRVLLRALSSRLLAEINSLLCVLELGRGHKDLDAACVV